MFFFHEKMIGFIIGLGLHNELLEGVKTDDHLNLVEEMHIFHLDPSLIHLEVSSSIFIRLKVPIDQLKI